MPCGGSMESITCLTGRIRANLYRVTPIFLEIFLCWTKSGLMVFTGGGVKVVVVRRILSGIFKRLNALGRFKVGVIR